MSETTTVINMLWLHTISAYTDELGKCCPPETDTSCSCLTDRQRLGVMLQAAGA
jgi:hypothetical protein